MRKQNNTVSLQKGIVTSLLSFLVLVSPVEALPLGRQARVTLTPSTISHFRGS